VSASCTLLQSDKSNSKSLEGNVLRLTGFVSVDENGDGFLDKFEFRNYLANTTRREVTEEDASVLLQRFDADNNGRLDYQELMAVHDCGALWDAGNSLLATKWDKALEQHLKDVPLKDIIAALRSHLDEGGKARVTVTENKLIVKLFIEVVGRRRFKVMQGTWETPGPRERKVNGAPAWR